MAGWDIKEVGEKAQTFFKKYPWLAWGGLAVAGGAGFYYALRSRGAAEESPAVSYPAEELPSPAPDAGLSADTLQELMQELLFEQGLSQAEMQETLMREMQAGYTELAETLRAYLEAGAPGGAYLPRTEVVYVAQPAEMPVVQAAKTGAEPTGLPETLAGTERLYTERQARTILEWAGMETEAQKAGALGTSALPESLAGSGLTVVYHPTGQVEFVPKGEKPTPSSQLKPATPELQKLYGQTEAESIGGRIAMIQKAYQGATTPEQKAKLHAEAEKLRQQAASKGISEQVERARIETWKTALGGT